MPVSYERSLRRDKVDDFIHSIFFLSGQAGAIRYGISRGLLSFSESFHQSLEEGLFPIFKDVSLYVIVGVS